MIFCYLIKLGSLFQHHYPIVLHRHWLLVFLVTNVYVLMKMNESTFYFIVWKRSVMFSGDINFSTKPIDVTPVTTLWSLECAQLSSIECFAIVWNSPNLYNVFFPVTEAIWFVEAIDGFDVLTFISILEIDRQQGGYSMVKVSFRRRNCVNSCNILEGWLLILFSGYSRLRFVRYFAVGLIELTRSVFNFSTNVTEYPQY